MRNASKNSRRFSPEVMREIVRHVTERGLTRKEVAVFYRTTARTVGKYVRLVEYDYAKMKLLRQFKEILILRRRLKSANEFIKETGGQESF